MSKRKTGLIEDIETEKDTVFRAQYFWDLWEANQKIVEIERTPHLRLLGKSLKEVKESLSIYIEWEEEVEFDLRDDLQIGGREDD